MKETDIIRGCKKGKASFQKELVKQYSPMLMTVCRRYARDESLAKDILQETLIRIFTNIHRYRPFGSFSGWMRKIAINTALQSVDKKCYRHELMVLNDYLESPSLSPSAYAHLGEEELLELINKLPNGFRQVFNLYVIDGFSHKEIGEMLNISESTSRSQLARAKKVLRDWVEELEYYNIKLRS